MRPSVKRKLDLIQKGINMKHITASEKIHIVHWSYFLSGRLFLVLYEKDGDKRHVKFLRPAPALAAYLQDHFQMRTSVDMLNAAGANWVDEDPFYEKGVEVPVKVDDGLMRFCAQLGVDVTEFLYAISCFMCNPANHDCIIAYLNGLVLEADAEKKQGEMSCNKRRDME